MLGERGESAELTRERKQSDDGQGIARERFARRPARDKELPAARTHTARIFADRADLWTISAVSSKIRAMLEPAARIFGRAAGKPRARSAIL